MFPTMVQQLHHCSHFVILCIVCFAVNYLIRLLPVLDVLTSTIDKIISVPVDRINISHYPRQLVCFVSLLPLFETNLVYCSM